MSDAALTGIILGTLALLVTVVLATGVRYTGRGAHFLELLLIAGTVVLGLAFAYYGSMTFGAFR